MSIGLAFEGLLESVETCPNQSKILMFIGGISHSQTVILLVIRQTVTVTPRKYDPLRFALFHS
jgi:hypothetical protein